jgi:cystathionine beta-lyase
VGFQTDCISTGEDRSQFHGSIAPPIYESSLFAFDTYEAFRRSFAVMEAGDEGWVYSRMRNPTIHVLERKLAILENGEAARVFASGMGAITAAVLHAARSGDHIVAVKSIYANAYRLLADYLPTLGIETTFVDGTDLTAVEAAITPATRVLYLESPGNPGMHVLDLPVLADLAEARDITTIVDNSMATPYNQRPLALGIQLVVHSMSKYLSGHSDVVAGAVIGPAERIRRITATEMRELGGGLPPFESWLVLRGIRTLGLRMRAHNEAGLRLARWLEGRPEVDRVLYPGLPSHPRHHLAAEQMRGFSGLLSIVLKGGKTAAERFVDRLRLFGIGVSWGGFESLALPIDPAGTAFAAEIGVVPGFVRLSIGLEDVDDLICDLQQSLEGLEHD